MILITISGLDGSGKSTQIELLKKYLKERDKSFWYFHSVDFSVGNKILKPKKNHPSVPSLAGGEDLSVTKANWFQIQLRKIALLIDICRFKRIIRKKKFDYIISDRYFYDTIINIMFLSACHSRESGNPGINDLGFSTGSRVKPGMTKWIERYIPKPNSAFFIKISPEKIMQRERKPDQGTEYLRVKEKLFEEKLKDWEMIVLDGEKSKEEIFDDIKSKINV